MGMGIKLVNWTKVCLEYVEGRYNDFCGSVLRHGADFGFIDTRFELNLQDLILIYKI